MPTLDGWRAIAILGVIFHHDAIHTLGIFNTRWVYEYGNSGVDVFFAISGILICSRLLDEESIFGRIHLKSFYIRRAFRILPPALLYLGVLAVLGGIGLVAVSKAELLRSVFFCRNFAHLFGSALETPGYLTGHFWSLALEEQFYFLLPALLVFTPKKFRAPLLGLLAALILVHRAIALQSRPWSLIQAHTDIRLDSLLVPAIFAVLAANSRWRPVFQRSLRFWPILVLGILCVLPYGLDTAWRATVIIWVMPCIVLGSVLNSQNIFGKILEFKPLKYIGRISYSLYLWQQLFFVDHFSPESHTLGWAQSWPLRLVLTFACAIASYHLLEKPLTRIGHKLAPSATPGRDELEAQSQPESEVPS
jgi:peptidoglycan/LPS O-acetylase OafA/YrhL